MLVKFLSFLQRYDEMSLSLELFSDYLTCVKLIFLESIKKVPLILQFSMHKQYNCPPSIEINEPFTRRGIGPFEMAHKLWIYGSWSLSPCRGVNMLFRNPTILLKES